MQHSLLATRLRLVFPLSVELSGTAGIRQLILPLFIVLFPSRPRLVGRKVDILVVALTIALRRVAGGVNSVLV